MEDDDPTTEELQRAQLERELAERQRASEGQSEDDTEQHERRADKASYLREKLEQRAAAEREIPGGGDR
ncbi:MAG: hypothetical protein NVSMB25_21960 [Thermoleophilaceae bacterium]